MNNIVFLDAATLGEDVSLAPIAEKGRLQVYDTTRPEEVSGRIAQAQVVIVNKVRLFQPQIDAASQLRLICVAATGTDNVDSAYARSKGIAVKNVKGYSTDSVAQLTFAHILALVQHIAYFDRYVQSGAYINSPIFSHHGRVFWELKGKRMGIIGMGEIGRRVAEIALAFGMEVVYFSTSGTAHCSLYPCLSLDDLLQTSDILSIHSPLNATTRGLIGPAQLAKMKPSAMLINMGRGGIVDEEALVNALNTGVIAGAATDVYTQEPLAAGHVFYGIAKQECLSLSPHIGWASIEARNRLVEMIAANI
jgi:Lactate dehydrogenase and related dehydrogenases